MSFFLTEYCAKTCEVTIYASLGHSPKLGSLERSDKPPPANCVFFLYKAGLLRDLSPAPQAAKFEATPQTCDCKSHVLEEGMGSGAGEEQRL